MQEVQRMLEIGTKAPEFSLPDQDGKIHSLSEYNGQKVILYFYPADMSPGCIAMIINQDTLLSIQVTEVIVPAVIILTTYSYRANNQ